MSLPESCGENLFAAGNELPDLLPEDDPMMIFSRLIYPAFNDREFEACYSEQGRPAISPAFLACVTLLQFRENLSDAETSRAVVRRLDGKRKPTACFGWIAFGAAVRNPVPAAIICKRSREFGARIPNADAITSVGDARSVQL